MSETVFISYGREDANAAKKVYDAILSADRKPWLDTECLIAGQKWEPAIRNAIKQSRYFIAIYSSSTVGRRGYANKEIRAALEILEEYPDSDIFLIPVRLDECDVPDERLNQLQRVDMFPKWYEGIRQIKKALDIFESDDASKQSVTAFINLTCESQRTSEVSEAIAKEITEADSVHQTFGSVDLVVVVKANDFRSIQDCAMRVVAIPGVSQSSTLLAMDTDQCK